MTSCSASGDVLKYLLLNLTWSLEASNSAPELSKRCVFGAEMLYAWHVPKAGFLATVWHPLLPIYFKVETKQKCSACQKKKEKKKYSVIFPSVQEWLKEQKHWTSDLHRENDELWLISINHSAISRHFGNKVSFFPALHHRWAELSRVCWWQRGETHGFRVGCPQAIHKSRSVYPKKP